MEASEGGHGAMEASEVTAMVLWIRGTTGVGVRSRRADNQLGGVASSSPRMCSLE